MDIKTNTQPSETGFDPDQKVEKYMSTQDASVEYMIDPADERAALRKIDFIVMPAMTFVYFFQYLDKQTINYASVFGLNDDLKLTGLEFSWVVTIFYFGQLASEFPCAYFMSRFPVTKVVGVCILLWGTCEMCMAATHNFKGIVTVRFFLGFFEGAASPAWVILTSNWYKRSEHPVRVAIWTSMAGAAQIIGAILMYLIGQAPPMAIENWRVMFIVCGSVTILSGIIFIFCVPPDGTKAWFFNEKEKRIAIERLALDRATRDKSVFTTSQFKEAVTELRPWVYFGMGFFICVPSPILKFSSMVVKGFGFNKFNTMLVGLPTGAIQIILILSYAYGMSHTKNYRWVWGLGATAVPLIGSILLLSLPSTASWGIVVSTWLAAQSSGLMLISLSLIASNIKGNTKKSTMSALYFIGYSAGCIIGPQLWQSEDAPRYNKGCISSIVSWVLLCGCFVAHFMLGKRENARRDRLAQLNDGLAVEESTGVTLDSDLTDTQDLKFRYTL